MFRKRISFDQAHQALAVLRDRLPRLIGSLGLADEVDLAGWRAALDRKLLPRFSPEFPLLVAIAGGGSAAKPTLFNALVGDRLSLAKSKAGDSGRVLTGANSELFTRPEVAGELFVPSGVVPPPLGSIDELATPGDPLYVTSE